ncbi:MAG: NnrU family protein [Myxococcota bacterium]
MLSLCAGIAFFVGIHLLISGTRARDRLVAAIGEGPYQGLFSLASLAGIVWAVRAYNHAPYIETWGQVAAGRSLMIVLMAVAFVLFGVGVTTPGPTGTSVAALERGEPPRGIHRITRHPFLWGAFLWALAHLIWNGDWASLVFFGGFAVLTLSGPISIDAKRARRHGEAWQRYAEKSSNVPFGAVASGRASLGADVLGEMGWWRIALALGLFVVALYGHTWAFGASPFPA